jgi:hypothetical protein
MAASGRAPPGEAQGRERRPAGTERLISKTANNSNTSTTARGSRRGGERILHRDPGGNIEWRSLSPYEARVAERTRAADAAWFEVRPRRSHRMRPAVPGELPGLTADMARDAWLVIRQIVPGLRVKQIFNPPGPPPDIEEIGHALFDLIAEHAATGECEIYPGEIRLRAAMLGAGGRA